MSILRIHKKQNNFVMLDKTCLYQKTLSWAAKGLHAYLISMPDDWRVQVVHLKDESRDGRDAVRSLLKELEQAGYIQRSMSRDNTSGRFGGIEYLVFEVPMLSVHDDKMPPPEKASLVAREPKNPATEIPESGNPSTENPTLININNTKYPEVNNKAAADEYCFSEVKTPQQEEKLAAALFFETQKNISTPTAEIRAFKAVSNRDHLIGEVMTSGQKERIRMLAENIAGSDPFCFPTAAQLEAEISFCLTSKNHFKACGQDFSYKLNAIKAVMMRGDWQTPSELVSEHLATEDKKVNRLQQDLNAAIAEARHFERLMTSASFAAKTGLAELYTKARGKIMEIEQMLQQTNEMKQA